MLFTSEAFGCPWEYYVYVRVVDKCVCFSTSNAFFCASCVDVNVLMQFSTDIFVLLTWCVCVCVCVPGESVEENSSVVVKLLIRRPECFGPALRGEGGNGLLAAMKEAIKISEDLALDLPSSAQGVSSDV